MTPQIVIMTDAEVEKFEKDEGLGALVTDKGPLPLKAVDVQARLEGLLAEVVLTQSFVNTHAEAVEATYIFPLPDRAAVTGFRMEVAGRVIEGTLKERAAARKEYDQAIEAGYRAGITEEERPNVFTMRVGNLPPGETAVVRLTMVGPVIYDSGEVTFRFPLVVAPRYIPGNPLDGTSVGDGAVVDTDAVPDASRITPPVLLPGYPNPVRFSMAVEVQPAGLPIGEFRSSLHAVVSEQLVNGGTRIHVERGDRLNRDFILRYRYGEPTIHPSLLLAPDADATAEAGTFALTVLPPMADSRKPIADSRTRDVVFVLDRSGSMDGWKMVAARRALGRMIDSLTERDRFTVLAFDEEVEAPELCGEGLASASDRNRFRVIEWLAHVEARGGTELAQPLALAVTQLPANGEASRERILVLLTDGQVGNEDQILQSFAQELKGIRIFTLGIDQAVNEGFLRRLAALGGGSCDVVESEDRLDEVMDKVQRRIGTPLWTGLRIEASGIELETDSQVPARLPDLFPGVPVTVFGRYRANRQAKVTLHATDDAGQPVKQTVQGQTSSNKAVTSVWARGKLRDDEDRWVVTDQLSKSDLQKQITELSLKYGVLCRFTAFVAVDRSETVNQGGKQSRLVQPVELPQGWEVPQAPAGAGPGVFKSMSGSMPLSAAWMPAGWDALSHDNDMEDTGLDGGDGFEEQETNGGSHPQEDVEELAQSLAPEIELDLTAYRKRAAEMLEQLRADKDAVHALGVLKVKLEALLEDLRSIGAEEDVMQPLAKLLKEIMAGKAKGPSALAKAGEVLRAFAEA